MLTAIASTSDVATMFAELRRSEFARLDETDVAYLDYTGAALYADRQVTRHLADLRHHVLGNPHSDSTPSLESTALIDDARQRVLRFLDADPSEYEVVFTANCSAAIKLVGESYPFRRGDTFLLTADNHNSINGIREYAGRAGVNVRHIPLDANLRLDKAATHLHASAGLFAFPAQSNFSGVQHPLSLIEDAQHAGYDVLLDAAAFIPTNGLSLREHRPEFVVLSLYKLFGYPTGVGALIARRDALARLNRPWFAGGTVNYVSVQHGMHELKHGAERFEDGTPSFATLGALRHGFDFVEQVGMAAIHAHVMRLTECLLDGLLALRRGSQPSVVVYGPHDVSTRGGTVTFNILDASGRPIPYSGVERSAGEKRIALRAGCFCNPGAAERAFAFDSERSLDCLRLASDGGFTLDRFARCMDDGTAVGAIRASVGIATNERDIERLLELVDAIGKR